MPLIKMFFLYWRIKKLTFELKVTYFGVHMSAFVALALVEFSCETMQGIWNFL